MKSHRTLALMLRNARNSLGRDRFDELVQQHLKAPLALYLSSHSTGCHATLSATLPGHPPIVVWYGSCWYDACYEFNDARVMCGLNPDFMPVEAEITAFFDRMEAAHAEVVAQEAVRKASASAGQSKRAASATQEILHALRG